MKRYDLINALIKKHNYKNYLEIGVRDNRCFDKIKIKDKSGVDPMKDDWEIEKGKATGWDSSKVPVKYRMTSDEYFEKHNIKYDIIFIDGLHENEQVYRDIHNSLNCLNEGGTILMHDCLPEKEEHQEIPRKSNYWNGDVWKAYVRVRNERKDVEMCVVDTDTGVGIIKILNKENYLSEPAVKGKLILDWNNYVENKEEWMNIVSTDYITLYIGEEYFENKRVQTFLHSGGLGDVIWSLPFVIANKGGDMYLRNHSVISATNMQFKGLFRILTTQPYIRKVIKYPINYANKDIDVKTGIISHPEKVRYSPDIEIDIDLDFFRLSPFLNKEHLLTSYFTAFKVAPQNLPIPFLKLDESFDFKNEELNKKVEIPKIKYNVFHITQRHRCDFDWKKLIQEQSEPNYFIGLKEEYDEIIKDYKVKDNLIYYGHKVKDVYDMAIMINHAENIFCNPSVVHCLAVGLNLPYNLVVHPDFDAVKTFLPIETIVNK